MAMPPPNLPENQEPPFLGQWYKQRWFLISAGVFLLLVLIAAASGGGSKPTASPVSKPSSVGERPKTKVTSPPPTAPPTTATTLPPTTTAPPPPPPPPQEVTYPYAQLVKEADGNLFMNATTGQACIFQFDASTGNDLFLGEMTNMGYSVWSDVAEFQLDSASVGDGFYQGDIVQYHGSVMGTDSYDTRAGGTNTVPVIQVTSMEKIGSGCD